MKIFVHTDDFGLTRGFTKATALLAKKTVVNSTSIRTNGTAFLEAIEIIKKLKGVRVGLHFNITDGPGINKQLIDSQGKYKYNFPAYLLLSFFGNSRIKNAVYYELNYQYKILKQAGVKIVHLDSHDHVHMVPWLFEIICKFCKKNNVRYVRVANEPIFYRNWKTVFSIKSILKHLLLKWLSQYNLRTLQKHNLTTANAFYGILNTNNMDSRAILEALKHARKNRLETIEILSHPAIININSFPYTSPFIKKYSNSRNRTIEYKALASRRVKNQILAFQ